ncbi:major facilitator superfamily MFS_1 [Paenibacillus pasadenensis]|uniref:Major facilitator superfamily MFS_1 n=1 Tax=Paenibacillus pasadenensis TaxID=217090 RepID=A0A2N5NCG2_9BACL|nr:MFS transporter [Paenibacillus pasadenensis]PLT48024.1 major facilitator superfamily MFS_1 [Paenibacillus pasadenensis]
MSTHHRKLGFNGLWKDSDFMKFWSGETLSLFGVQITSLAIPLVAAETLQVTPAQMGLLNAAQYLPFLLITLFAGVWIDRNRRRPVLIAANAGRALLLALIPLSFLGGWLQVEHLYLIVFLTGVLTVFFDLAYQSYLPSLVTRSHVVEGNSKLQLSASMAQVSGPGLSGALISIVTAPLVIGINAATYLISAIFMGTIQRPEPIPPPPEARASVLDDIREGIGIVFRNPYLRALAGEAATYNLFSQVSWAVLILYLTRSLHIGPALLGIILSVSSIGALLGSLAAGRIHARLRTGSVLLGSILLACIAPLLVPLASGPLPLSVPLLILSFFLSGFGVVISNIHIISLRQTVTPEHLLGRMNASYRFVVTGTAPIGALLGGWLGTGIGLRLTLAVGAAGTLAAVLWIFFSPVPRLDGLPDGIEGRP